jgi:hypothetical protein
MSVTLTDSQRKAAIQYPFLSGHEARSLEEWLKTQTQRLSIMTRTTLSYGLLLSFIDP